MDIAFIQTGGTIDKDYPKKTGGYAFEIDSPAFERVITTITPGFNLKSYSLFKKDSLEITQEDRQSLQDFIQEIEEQFVIITHGTDSLIETAQHLNAGSKVIVLTGAKLPERFVNSDAALNIGVAIGAVQSKTPGVYIAMQGLVLPVNAITRDAETGIFQFSE